MSQVAAQFEAQVKGNGRTQITMSNLGTRKLRLNFGNLPLVDAAVRASFESPVELTFRSVNYLAEQLRADFPLLSELDQFQLPPGVKDPSMTLGPRQIPGAVYDGHKDGLSISLQSQVAVARWAKRVGPSAPEYPRYQPLASALWRAVECFREVCGSGILRIIVVNMSYENFLHVSHDERVLHRYFSERAHFTAANDARKIHKIEASWQEEDGVDVRLTLEAVTARVGEETVEGFRLKTTAGSRLAEGASERESLDLIHDRLQAFFVGILSDEAKNEWDLEVEDD